MSRPARRKIFKPHPAEVKLRDSDEISRLLIHEVRDYAIFALDPHGRVMTWNEGAQNIKGYSADEIVGQHFSRFYTPEDVAAGIPLLELKIATEQGRFEGEGWRVHKDGRRFWANVVITALRDESGELRGFGQVTRDITARNQAQEALRQSEEKFRLLVQSVRDYATFMLDPQGQVTTWNEVAQHIKGYSEGEIVGEHFSRFYTPEDVAAGLPAMELKAATEQGRLEQEGWRVRKDGSRFWASVVLTALRDGTGQLFGFCKCTRDVTERRKAESEPILLTERLSLATAIAKVGVWEWDVVNGVVAWDNTMFEIYGLPPTAPLVPGHWSAPVPYEKWSGAVCPEDRPAAESALQKTIEQKEALSSEFCITLPDGKVRNILSMQKAVHDPTGKVSRIVGVNIDITDKKKEEAAREEHRKDQLRLKDEFLSHVSHEIRSPLSAIMQFTSIVLDGLAGKVNEEQRKYEEIVMTNARQLKSMIDDLLAVTGLENGKLKVAQEAVPVIEIVTDALNTHRGNASSKGVSLSCELPATLPPIYADPIRFRQILNVLTDNAIKFTPSGGMVKIAVQPWEEDPDFLCIEVSDTGSGIEAKNLDKIFERLYQTSDPTDSNREGLGLGLFICKELVTRHGGRIWVKSQVNEGSTFSFILPVFSLKKLMAPLLKNNQWPRPSAALVTVKVRSRKEDPSEPARMRTRMVRALIRSCLTPDLDVLLPQMESETDQDRFLISTFADEQGASALSRRIQDQLEDCPQLAGGPIVTVFHTMLSPFAPKENELVDDIVATFVASLEEAIRSHETPLKQMAAAAQ